MISLFLANKFINYIIILSHVKRFFIFRVIRSIRLGTEPEPIPQNIAHIGTELEPENLNRPTIQSIRVQFGFGFGFRF
jgi:hypothetical protein